MKKQGEKLLNDFYINHAYKKVEDNICPASAEDKALQISNFAGLLVDVDDDHGMDAILYELYDMDISRFRQLHPDIYKKYYEDKIIESKHISVSYWYGFVASIEKVYVSETGFSISDIAELIRAQLQKYNREYNEAKREERTPKHLTIPVCKYWNVRFDILCKPLGMDNECYGCYRGKCGVCKVRKIPHVMVRIDT
jgi:hypothetical protein